MSPPHNSRPTFNRDHATVDAEPRAPCWFEEPRWDVQAVVVDLVQLVKRRRGVLRRLGGRVEALNPLHGRGTYVGLNKVVVSGKVSTKPLGSARRCARRGDMGDPCQVCDVD
jgi:hypothetical protein